MTIKEILRVLRFIFSAEFLRMSVYWTLSLLISYIRWYLWVDESSIYSRQPVTGIADKRPVCIITGATSGLGAATAHALATEGFFVVLVGRSGHLLSETMSEIRKLNDNAQLEAFVVDLSSFSSIMKFRKSFQQWLLDMNLHSSIQLLINNAGMLATSYRITSDGFDEMMMTNFFGAFCLTKVLLPLLMDSPVPSRIVNLSSFTHRSVSGSQVNEEFLYGNCISNVKPYPFAHVYEYSKLCIILFSYKLHQEIDYMETVSQLSVNIADPGVVKTNIMREVPSCLSQLAFVVLRLIGLLQYPESGVSSILDAARAPPEISGKYFFGGKGRTLNSSPISYNAKLADKLWTTSCNLFQELQMAYQNNIAPTSAQD